jgi:hypothetical protein
MEEGREGVIKEENDEDAQSFTTTDSFADEEARRGRLEDGEEEEDEGELEDYTSLAFERALENSGGKNSRYNYCYCFWRAFSFGLAVFLVS